jgi:hypothetical protein
MGAETPQFIDEKLIAALNAINIINFRYARCRKPRHDQRRSCTKIARIDMRARKRRSALYDR